MSYNKYGNTKVQVDGIDFDSKKEAARYGVVELLQMGQRISQLQLQVKMDILVNDMKICAYVADFTYFDEHGKLVIEDVKSEITRKLPVYRLKKKLIKAIYGIEITEI